MKNFVVLDLETTGLTPKTDRILEIGAVKVVDGEIKERYSTFINPQMEIPRRITELTGITGDMAKLHQTAHRLLPERRAVWGSFARICRCLDIISCLITVLSSTMR